jgi:penicillin-binding protein 1A
MDLWFLGYTSRLVAGLWVGFDQPRSLGSHETAGRLAAPVWADFMRRALRGVTPEPIPIPEDVLPARVNYRTGLPADASDPEGITEFFIRGDMGSPAAGPEVPAPPSPPTPPTIPIAPLPVEAGQQ